MEASLTPLHQCWSAIADSYRDERTKNMGTDSVLFQIILLLHIGVAIVGFGGVISHSLFHAKAVRSPAAAAGTVLETTTSVAKLAEYAIYAVLPLGIILIVLSDDLFSMGDPWVSASFVVWFLLVGTMHGAVRPAVKVLAQRAQALEADAVLENDSEAAGAVKKLMIGEMATQLLLVVALFLMIWKPGA